MCPPVLCMLLLCQTASYMCSAPGFLCKGREAASQPASFVMDQALWTATHKMPAAFRGAESLGTEPGKARSEVGSYLKWVGRWGAIWWARLSLWQGWSQ
jgi:hypothetical protein